MSKSIYIYPRFDSIGDIYFEGRQYKLHLVGKEDETRSWDKFLFSSAKEVLGNEEGKIFKEQTMKVLNYMAAMNKMGEKTKELRPILCLFNTEE